MRVAQSGPALPRTSRRLPNSHRVGSWLGICGDVPFSQSTVFRKNVLDGGYFSAVFIDGGGGAFFKLI